MSNQIPIFGNVVPDWKVIPIKSLGYIVTGSTPDTKLSENYGGYVPFVSPADIGAKKTVVQTVKTLSPLGLTKTRSIPANSVMVVCIGSTIGKVSISSKHCATNQQINSIISNEYNSNEFIFYSMIYLAPFIKLMSGTQAVPIINKTEFGSLLTIQPPLPEQQKIAAILTSVDEVIEKTQAQINKLKDLKTGMMQELLTRGVGVDGKPHTEFKDSPVGRIPKGWDVVTLGCVTLESAFGPRFSSDEYAVDGNIGCIRTTDMDENWDINYSTAPLARLNFKEFEKHLLVDGDLLVTRSGTCGLVDVFRKQSIPMVAAAFLIRFRLDDTVNPFFVRYLMMSTDIQESVQMLASGGVQKNLSGTSLKTLKIPKPSIKEQNQIVEVVESINKRISVANKKLILNRNLKKALMQDLLTGKVRVKVDS